MRTIDNILAFLMKVFIVVFAVGAIVGFIFSIISPSEELPNQRPPRTDWIMNN